MKEIQNYEADKYPKAGIAGLFKKSKYKRIKEGIYQLYHSILSRIFLISSIVIYPTSMRN